MSMEYIVTINGTDKNQLKWRLNDTTSIIQYSLQSENDNWTDFENSGGTVNNWGDIGGTLSNQTDLQNALDLKVDKIAGKGLSTVDFSLAYQTKLDGIAIGATANSTDSYLLNRANHTGTQEISTINNLQLTITGLQNNIGDLGTAISQVNDSVLLKANIASPTFTGTVVLPSTTSIGNVTNVEISYIDGLTSNVQTQLNNKISTTLADSKYGILTATQTWTGINTFRALDSGLGLLRIVSDFDSFSRLSIGSTVAPDNFNITVLNDNNPFVAFNLFNSEKLRLNNNGNLNVGGITFTINFTIVWYKINI